MTPPEDDAGELQLAVQLERYDECLRGGSHGPADLADAATATLTPEAQDRLRRARFALRRLKNARPQPSLVPTHLPAPVAAPAVAGLAHPAVLRPARDTGATAAERDAQALLARRLRILFGVTSFYMAYMLVVCVGGMYEALMGPIGDAIAHALFGWAGEALLGLAGLSHTASAVLLWRRSLSTPALRRLEVVNLTLITVLLAYWHYRLFTIVPPAGFEGPPHEVWLLYVVANVQLIWLVTIMAYGLFVPQSPWRCALLTGTLTASALGVTTLTAFGNPVIARILPVALLEIGVVLAGAAGLCIYSTLKIQALEHQVRAARQEVRELGQYTLGRLLGAGGMGEVYLAEHRLLKRPCAVKLIQPQRAGDAGTLDRFEREVQATARLSHPNVVEVFDYGRAEDGTFFYVMEYLSGLSLEELVRRHGPMQPARAVHILRQICGALREAHAAGLVHRDIKPGNVIVCEHGPPDRAKLLDFGLVRSADPAGFTVGLTGEWGLVGTPGYIAPEQIEGGRPLDTRGDLYSLGAVAYYLLSGRPPFDGGSVMKTLASQLLDAPRPLRTGRPDLPAALEEVVLRCLELEPTKRFADAAKLDRALARCTDPWTEDEAAAWWQHAAVAVPPAPATVSLLPGSRPGFA
ncbi:MAG: serine/threonine protein kinase [Planctomycetia bacterium]|nr:serine/threonine protein kinase [Planctomycetia bacterium]